MKKLNTFAFICMLATATSSFATNKPKDDLDFPKNLNNSNNLNNLNNLKNSNSNKNLNKNFNKNFNDNYNRNSIKNSVDVSAKQKQLQSQLQNQFQGQTSTSYGAGGSVYGSGNGGRVGNIQNNTTFTQTDVEQTPPAIAPTIMPAQGWAICQKALSGALSFAEAGLSLGMAIDDTFCKSLVLAEYMRGIGWTQESCYVLQNEELVVEAMKKTGRTCTSKTVNVIIVPEISERSKKLNAKWDALDKKRDEILGY